MKTKISAIIFMVFSAIFASVGQILYKFASKSVQDFFSLVFNPFLILGIFSYGLGLVFMLKAIRRGELTVVYPVLATSFIWVSLLSPIFFETDSMTLQKWVGIFVIVTGITLIGKGRAK